MTLFCGERRTRRSPSLSNEGKPVIPMVLPKGERAATLLLAQRITRLSGSRVKLDVIVDVPEASLNFQPFKLKAVVETFLISTYSALGKLTTGTGSAIISV